jgi:hypothetical protein
MAWEWWANEPARLAGMVAPDLYEGRRDLIPADILSLRNSADKRPAVGALYELFKLKGLSYDLNPPALGVEADIQLQRVRQPREVFDGGRGTCLDLALIFCGMCASVWLRPFLALLALPGRRDLHALVIIGPSLRDAPDDQTDADLRAINGQRDPMPWGELEQLLRQGWLAVDLTVATRKLSTADTLRPAEFPAACDIAVSLLREATKITVLDIVRLRQSGLPAYPADSLSWASGPEFRAEVRDRYRDALAAAGLTVPDHWGRQELDRLRAEYQQRGQGPDSVTDLLDALCGALDALPILEQVGGREIGIRKLQDVYRRHVGRWPDSSNREEMLVLAASAGIAELRAPVRPEPLIAPARFMLGIAGYRKAPEPRTLADPDLSGLSQWLTQRLDQQWEDADAYLAASVAGRTWALVELLADDPAAQAWPDLIAVDLVHEDGPGDSYNERCPEKSNEGIKQALRSAISRLPEGEVCVDLFMPRQWLDAGVEYWDVVDVGGTCESMSQHLRPRLRWSMHRRNRWLRDKLRQRFLEQNWFADPEVIPQPVVADPLPFADWLDSMDGAGTVHPPYFAARSPGEQAHDPLGALLRDGHGFVVWFAPDASAEAELEAKRLAVGRSAQQRRHDLPSDLAASLRAYRPAIIWTDPEGRAGFQLPAARRGGTLRGGTG